MFTGFPFVNIFLNEYLTLSNILRTFQMHWMTHCFAWIILFNELFPHMSSGWRNVHKCNVKTVKVTLWYSRQLMDKFNFDFDFVYCTTIMNLLCFLIQIPFVKSLFIKFNYIYRIYRKCRVAGGFSQKYRKNCFPNNDTWIYSDWIAI